MPLSWPVGVPSTFLEDGYGEVGPNNLIEDHPDVGPLMTRRRSTSAPSFFRGQILMTTIELALWIIFEDTTTASRALTFSMAHPRTGAAVTVWQTQPRDVRSAGPGRWMVSLAFMVLP